MKTAFITVAALALAASTASASEPTTKPTTTKPLSVADAKLKTVGKAKEEAGIMKAVRDVETSLVGEAAASQAQADKDCTDDQSTEVKLAPFAFHGRSSNLVEGCEATSTCGKLVATEKRELPAIAAAIDSNKGASAAKSTENSRLSGLNEDDEKAMTDAQTASKAATALYKTESANIANAVRVLTQIRARLKENGKLVFTQDEAKVLGSEHVAFLQAAAKGIGSKAEVDALAKLIDELIAKLKNEGKAVHDAENAQVLRTKGQVQTHQANIQTRQAKIAANAKDIMEHNRIVAESTPRLALKMSASANIADGCVQGHTAYKETMFSLRRELVVIREIKGYVAPAPVNSIALPGSFGMVSKSTSRKKIGKVSGSDMTVSCLWKDQGWGNRKGQFEACGTKCVRISTYAAPHKWERFTFTVPASLGAQVTFLAQGVCYSPGHKLYVKDCKVSGRPVAKAV